MQRRAVVLGGSVAGLAIAVALARRGWRVDVVERDPSPPLDEAIPGWDRAPMDRQILLRDGVMRGLRDPVLGRAVLRRTNLLDPPERTLEDPEVVAHARRTIEILAGKPPRELGPTRDELLDLLERSRVPTG